jgi:uncharacterized protein involved in exopolysaccharide biosynthesis
MPPPNNPITHDNVSFEDEQRARNQEDEAEYQRTKNEDQVAALIRAALESHYQALRTENAELRAQINDLTTQNAELRAQYYELCV